jgi:hypothetical protein
MLRLTVGTAAICSMFTFVTAPERLLLMLLSAVTTTSLSNSADSCNDVLSVRLSASFKVMPFTTAVR